MVKSDSANTGCAGCVKWWVLIFIVPFAVLIAGGLVWNAITGGPETIPMRGEVVIAHPADILVLSNGQQCRGFGRLSGIAGNTDMSVWARGGNSSSTMTDLSSGVVMPDETCVFRFSTTVRDADRYTFEILGLPEITRQASLIDTVGDDGERELEVRLEW